MGMEAESVNLTVRVVEVAAAVVWLMVAVTAEMAPVTATVVPAELPPLVTENDTVYEDGVDGFVATGIVQTSAVEAEMAALAVIMDKMLDEEAQEVVTVVEPNPVVREAVGASTMPVPKL
jgi:hypothetical protein